MFVVVSCFTFLYFCDTHCGGYARLVFGFIFFTALTTGIISKGNCYCCQIKNAARKFRSTSDWWYKTSYWEVANQSVVTMKTRTEAIHLAALCYEKRPQGSDVHLRILLSQSKGSFPHPTLPVVSLIILKY